MKSYIIVSKGEYVKAIFFKNTARMEEPTFWKCLAITRKPSDEDFVNCNYFFTGKIEEALQIKNPNLAYSLANKIGGYIEEVEL